jgi:hypothetical protein
MRSGGKRRAGSASPDGGGNGSGRRPMIRINSLVRRMRRTRGVRRRQKREGGQSRAVQALRRFFSS